MNTAVKERVSPGAEALSAHAKLCRRCMAVAVAGRPLTDFCPAGVILALAAIRARARRQAP